MSDDSNNVHTLPARDELDDSPISVSHKGVTMSMRPKTPLTTATRRAIENYMRDVLLAVEDQWEGRDEIALERFRQLGANTRSRGDDGGA